MCPRQIISLRPPLDMYFIDTHSLSKAKKKSEASVIRDWEPVPALKIYRPEASKNK